MPQSVAFIGLGVMGYPMAGHLSRAGHRVTVFNRTRARADEWAATYAGHVADTPADAAREADVVMACVGNDDDVRAVTRAPAGAFGTMRRDTIFVDHTTTSATLARELSVAAAAHGIAFLDAPVSGGQAGAEQGILSVMVGGNATAFDRVAPLLSAYGRKVKRIGASGSGQLAKMVNQICIAGLVQGLAEALQFARAADLDIPGVIEVISRGAAQSWQMENRWHTMVDGQFDFGFAVDWMRKDLGFALAEARRNGASLPVTALVDQFYAEVQAMGGRRWDTSSLITRLAPAPASRAAETS